MTSSKIQLAKQVIVPYEGVSQPSVVLCSSSGGDAP